MVTLLLVIYFQMWQPRFELGPKAFYFLFLSYKQKPQASTLPDYATATIVMELTILFINFFKIILNFFLL